MMTEEELVELIEQIVPLHLQEDITIRPGDVISLEKAREISRLKDEILEKNGRIHAQRNKLAHTLRKQIPIKEYNVQVGDYTVLIARDDWVEISDDSGHLVFRKRA